MNQKCENCRFWKVGNNGDSSKDLGLCRKKSPTIIFGQLNFIFDGRYNSYRLFPTTNPDDWCGEFEERSCKQCKSCNYYNQQIIDLKFIYLEDGTRKVLCKKCDNPL